MIKFRWYYDKDKEETFLNNMSSKGYAMTKFFLGFYTFEKCEPNEYTYRVDLIRDKTEKELEEYLELIKDSGIELVQRWGLWVFFRKKGEFELYTDIDSQISIYSRIQKTFLIFSIIELGILPLQWQNYFRYNHNFMLFTATLISIIVLAFLYQVLKCSSKIAKLKNQK